MIEADIWKRWENWVYQRCIRCDTIRKIKEDKYGYRHNHAPAYDRF